MKKGKVRRGAWALMALGLMLALPPLALLLAEDDQLQYVVAAPSGEGRGAGTGVAARRARGRRRNARRQRDGDGGWGAIARTGLGRGGGEERFRHGLRRRRGLV